MGTPFFNKLIKFSYLLFLFHVILYLNVVTLYKVNNLNNPNDLAI